LHILAHISDKISSCFARLMFSNVYATKLFYSSNIQDLTFILYFRSRGMSMITGFQMVDVYADMFSDGYGTYKTRNDG
jgi:hypothetical protein